MIEFVYLTISNYVIGNLNVIIGILFSLALYRYTEIYYINSKTDDVNTERLMKHIKEHLTFVQNYFIFEGEKEPYGYCFSWKHKFVAHINQSSGTGMGSKKTTQITFIGDLPEDIKKDEPSKVDVEEVLELYLARAYYNDMPQLVKLPFSGFEPKKRQLEIMKQIKDIYDDSKFNICRTLIYGDPGKGKSFIGKLLAKELDTKLCFDLNVLEPGNGLMTLWRSACPKKETPLIVQIDEFDVLIKNIHNNEVDSEHKWLRRLVYDKQTFNTFMSEYVNCLPNIIYIFTMNSSKEDIDKLDESYLRENRMDLVVKW
jgi:hypothetical protein